MYALVPATPSTTTIDDVGEGWVGSHLSSSSMGGCEAGVESIESEGSICPQTFGAKSISGESFGGHSVGFHVGSYRNESFPEALVKVNQPAIGLGVGGAVGDGVPESEAKVEGVGDADGPPEPAVLAPQAGMPIPRRSRAPDLANVRVSNVRSISSLSLPLRGMHSLAASDNSGYRARVTMGFDTTARPAWVRSRSATGPRLHSRLRDPRRPSEQRYNAERT